MDIRRWYPHTSIYITWCPSKISTLDLNYPYWTPGPCNKNTVKWWPILVQMITLGLWNNYWRARLLTRHLGVITQVEPWFNNVKATSQHSHWKFHSITQYNTSPLNPRVSPLWLIVNFKFMGADSNNTRAHLNKPPPPHFIEKLGFHYS